MKTLKYITLLITACIAFSCSDTIVIEAPAAPIIIDESAAALPVSGQFTKRVLIEDYTGTWCGNCAKVAYGIDRVFAQPNIKAVAVAIHNGNDPYNFLGIAPLKDLISPDEALALPQARLNRTIVWTDPDTNIQDVYDLTSANTGLGLAMTSTVTAANVNLEVKVSFAQNYSNLKLVVLLLENNLVHFQQNYSTYYNGGGIIQNFEHNHVLRKTLTNILGDPLTESTLSGESITKTYSVALPLASPLNTINSANISFAAFIVDENNKVINVRAANANEIQLLEQNP